MLLILHSHLLLILAYILLAAGLSCCGVFSQRGSHYFREYFTCSCHHLLEEANTTL